MIAVSVGRRARSAMTVVRPRGIGVPQGKDGKRTRGQFETGQVAEGWALRLEGNKRRRFECSRDPS